MAAPAKTGPHPLRALIALAALVVIMGLGIVSGNLSSPGHWHTDFRVGLGLDLSSGTQVTMSATTPTGGAPSGAEMNQAKSIILARVNGTGNSGAMVQTQGSRELTVSVPGPPNSQTENLVSETALLTFRQVLLYGQYSPTATPAASATSSASGDTSLVGPSTLRLFGKLTCKPGDSTAWRGAVGYNTAYDYDNPGVQVVACDSAGDKYVLDKATVPGTQIGTAGATLSPSTNQWQVDLTLKSAGAAAFAKLTAKQAVDYVPNVTASADDAALDRVAIVLDGNVITAPATRTSIPGGTFTITDSSFTRDSATQLQNVLKYGSLPLHFDVFSVQTVSAQLGQAQLDAGLIAAAIGLGLVAVYSFCYYRGLGLVSVSSLVVAAGLVMASVVLLTRYQGLRLELAGIAGLIVAIGITADSFVVFFERLRDEVREGRPLRPAVEAGWKRARRTILVSDTVSFIAAALLYYFSIGEVKGFAYMLGLTTIIDLVVVFAFTKPMVTLLARTRFFGSGRPLSGLDPVRLGARTPWRSSVPRSKASPR
jgi:preprotein translocase subunit SecD